LLQAVKAIIFSATNLIGGANHTDLHLRGMSVLITGASKGIGAATPLRSAIFAEKLRHEAYRAVASTVSQRNPSPHRAI
jgi:hypothetical protein